MPRSRKLFEKLIKPIKRRKPKKEIKDIVAEQGPKEFSFETLSSATESFDAKNKIGKGGFGQVYKGKLNDGREIVVKRPLQISDKGKELDLNELKLLLESAHHRNIVKFLGFCSHREEMLLVFEFASNGSLDDLLFNSEVGKTDALEWKRTYDIIVGVARALLYLHEQSQNVIIHCDIKPANILLDENWVPKIADFGTACFLPQDQTHVCISKAVVTYGYSAPEYVSVGHVSPKADIYSFGIIVLELISGEKNWLSHSQSSNGQGLRDRAKELWKKGKVSEFMHQKLIPSADLHQAQSCIEIGVLCSEPDPNPRPTMDYVCSMLSGNLSSSILVEEPMRDGSLSSSIARNSGQKKLANNGSSSETDVHLENEGLPIDRRLIHSRQIQPKDVQSSIANNGSSSGADIHLENKGLPKHKRRPFQPEDMQSYIPSIPSSACSSSGNSIQIEPEEGPVQAATQENEGLPIDRRLIHSRQIQPKDVQSSIANNGSSSEADIHLENKGLPKHRRRPFQPEDVQSYIPSIPSSACSSSGNSIQIEPEEGPVQAATQQVAAVGAEEEEDEEGIPILMITEDAIETSARQSREKTPFLPAHMTKQTKEALKKVAKQQQTVEEEANTKHRTTLNDTEEQPVNSTPEDRVIMPEIKVDKERLAAADAKDCWLAFTKLKSSETSFKKSLNDEGNESSWCEDECFER